MTSSVRRLPALALAATCVALILFAAPRSGPDSLTVPAVAVQTRTGAPHDLVATRSASEAVAGSIPATLQAAPRYAGTATWYCGGGSPCTHGYGPSDLVAAIDTDLGFRKGDRIVVRAFGRSVTVRIVDVCACVGERLVDLSRKAFARLADPDYGVIAVTVELARERAVPVGPETDVGP